MNYYILDKYYKKGDIQIASLVISQSIDQAIYKGISLLEEPLSTVRFKNKTGKQVDYPIGGTSLPVVSDTFRKFIEQFEQPQHLEFLPLDCQHVNNLKCPYWLLNILNNIPCFDWTNSIYTRYPDHLQELANRVRTVDKLVIDEEKVGGRVIFRMSELPTYIFVQEYFKRFVEENSLTGIRFTESLDFEKW